jgi:hypothetical protein
MNINNSNDDETHKSGYSEHRMTGIKNMVYGHERRDTADSPTLLDTRRTSPWKKKTLVAQDP